ncbi:hypothetical protein [Neptunicella sp.]|uniref:hypothetical protein n=1 Tax=Neptunicella sp. TaxID=2125986 RepID=UPI003F68D8CD
MNQVEYGALAELDMPPFVLALYIRCFRANMDYQSGVVSVSLSGMRQAMECHPPRGSTREPTKPSKSKIRHAVAFLLRCGLIELVQKGSIHSAQAAKYCCVLASFNAKRVFSAQNEERHESDTGTTRTVNSLEPSILKGCGENVVKFKKPDERHITDLTEQEDIYTRAQLIFDGQFSRLANSVGLVIPDEELEALFVAWQVTPDYEGVNASMATHFGQWRKYCASVRVNILRKTRGHYASGKQADGRYENSTARTLSRCKQQAIATGGVDFTVLDESPNRAGRKS